MEANDSLKHLHKISADKHTQGNTETPGYSEPLLNISSAAGIAQTSHESIVIAAGANIHLNSQQHTNLSVGKKLAMVIGEAWSVFVDKLGIKLFAGKGNVEVQAHSGNVEITAQKNIILQAIAGILSCAAGKEIIFNCNGNYIRIHKGGIEIHCTGHLSLKSADYTMNGPGGMAQHMPLMPVSETKSDEFFIIHHDQTGEGLAHWRYEITLETGEVFQGTADEKGKTSVAKSLVNERAQVKIWPPIKNK